MKCEAGTFSISAAYLRETLHVSRERMGRLLDVSARTIQRWEYNDQLPSNRWVTNVLVQLDEIVSLGLHVYTPEGFQVVMTQPQPAFGAKSGLAKIEAGENQDVYAEFAGAHEGYIGR